jgi:hypothetical protein
MKRREMGRNPAIGGDGACFSRCFDEVRCIRSPTSPREVRAARRRRRQPSLLELALPAGPALDAPACRSFRIARECIADEAPLTRLSPQFQPPVLEEITSEHGPATD